MATLISLSITFLYILLSLFLVVIDLMVNVFLFTYAFQFSVYGIYLGLFVVCHATGNLHKLEKTEVTPPTKRLKRKKNKKLDVGRFKVEVVRGEDESGYLTDLDDLNIIDIGENVE